MEHTVELQDEREYGVMEAQEIDGAKLLVDLLDASLSAEEEAPAAARGKHRQLGFPADDISESWVDDELNSIHPHQEEGCEDCGLELDGIILSGFDGCGCSLGPYVVDEVGNAVGYWAEELEMEPAAFGSFTGDSVGEWYTDGMAMGWDEGRSYYSFYPSDGGEACAEAEQPYISPLWV